MHLCLTTCLPALLSRQFVVRWVGVNVASCCFYDGVVTVGSVRRRRWLAYRRRGFARHSFCVRTISRIASCAAVNRYARHFLACCRRILGQCSINDTTIHRGHLLVDNQGHVFSIVIAHAGIEPAGIVAGLQSDPSVAERLAQIKARYVFAWLT